MDRLYVDRADIPVHPASDRFRDSKLCNCINSGFSLSTGGCHLDFVFHDF